MKLDSAAEFEAVYEQYATAIYRFIYWRTRDSEVAQDITSAVFERAWRSRASFTGGSVQAWLYRIARNSVIDYWRKKKDLPMDDVEGVANVPAEPTELFDYDGEQLGWQLAKALDTLSEEWSSVVVLRFIEGLSVREVAESLGLSEGNVRVIQFRALRQMRKMISDEAKK